MRKKMGFTLLAIATVLSTASCCDQVAPEKQNTKGRLCLTVTADAVQTKVTDAQIDKDQAFNSLDVFVFNNNADSRQGALDAHFTLDPEEVVNNVINLTVSQGAKIIYVMANATQLNNTEHKISWTGITNLTAFLAQTVSLAKEEIGNYFMWGTDNSTVTTSGTANINLTRLISRVKLNTLQTNFTGSAFEGTELKEVKAYLINVTGNRTLTGEAPAVPIQLNSAALIPADVSATRIPNALAEELGTLAEGTPLSAPRYFYAYANPLTQESEGKSFTRLVIEAKFASGAPTVYYPINIPNLEPNATYSYNITIKRPGTLTPDEPITFGSVEVSLTVTPWKPDQESTMTF